MIIERPAIDWLTLTTFDRKTAMDLDALVYHTAGKNNKSMPAKIKGYDGQWGDGFFCGEGLQGRNGYAHWLFNLWGEMSDKVMFGGDLNKVGDKFDCTRLDAQITLPWPHGNAFDAFYKSILVVKEWEQGKAKGARTIDPIVPPTGWCTLYVGAKTSDRRYRIYMKGEEDDLYIRFEAMYRRKKSYAGRAYDAISNEPDSITRVIAEEIFSLPKEAPIVEPFHEFVKTITGKPLPKGSTRPTPDKTLNWLVRQVMPAFKRVLGNEDTRFTAAVILQDLCEFLEEVR
jgi:hypothetical protein